MLKKLRVPLLIGLTLGALAFVACSSDDDDNGGDATAEATTAEGTATVEATTAGTDDEQVDVAATLADFSITLDDSEVPAGQVHINASNTGATPHELVIIRSDEAPDALPIEGALVPEADVDFVGEIEEFPAGEQREAAFQLEAGRYLLICNVAGHYELGMVAELTVN